jgi:two-component system response regulator
MSEGDILLVEDNPDDVELTLNAFKSNRIMNRVVVARDGVEALEYLFGGHLSGPEARAPLPAVMILDLNLPRVPGFEVLRRVRANPRTRLLPTVILTTSVDDRDLIEGYSLGANAYVRKPVIFEDFVAAARTLGLFWLLLNVRPPATG